MAGLVTVEVVSSEDFAVGTVASSMLDMADASSFSFSSESWDSMDLIPVGGGLAALVDFLTALFE